MTSATPVAASRPRTLAPLKQMGQAVGECHTQAQAYGQCMLRNYQEMERDRCAAEFRAFKTCVQTQVRPGVYGLTGADEAPLVTMWERCPSTPGHGEAARPVRKTGPGLPCPRTGAGTIGGPVPRWAAAARTCGLCGASATWHWMCGC